VATSLALVAIRDSSQAVISLCDNLDKDVETLRDALHLPRDPARWTTVLAARLACHERIFQQRIKSELAEHRHALMQIYPVDEQNGDLLHGLHAAVASAGEAFRQLENTYHLLNFLYDGYLLQLDASDRETIQMIHPALAQSYERLHADYTSLSQNITEWGACFDTVIGNAGPAACDSMLRKRRFDDVSVFSRELAPLFQDIEQYLHARLKLRASCLEICDTNITDLLS
ncbi:hypothetical protein FKP32DRAFT_1528333, partial [Trametes sanguinea]